MISAPDTTDRQSWRVLIQALADERKGHDPDAAGRIDKAVSMLLMGDVELLDDGNALAGSQSHGNRAYTVYDGRRCECPDGFRTHCKHLIAVELLRQALTQMPVPAAEPASFSFVALLDGTEVEMTLHAASAEALLRKLQAVFQRQAMRPLVMPTSHAT